MAANDRPAEIQWLISNTTGEITGYMVGSTEYPPPPWSKDGTSMVSPPGGLSVPMVQTNAITGATELLWPDGSIPILLKSVTTVYLSATSAALATNTIIPFNATLRDDLGVSDVATNAGRILIPSAAKRMRITSNVLCVANQGGTYRRQTTPIVVNGVTLSAITTPSSFGTCQTVAPVFVGAVAATQLSTAEFDMTDWGITADDGNSYVESKVFHDGTAGSGNQITINTGSFMSVEFWN